MILPNYQLAMESDPNNNNSHSRNNKEEAPLRRCAACREQKRNFFTLNESCGHEFCKDCLSETIRKADTPVIQSSGYYCPNINCHAHIGTGNYMTIDAWKNPNKYIHESRCQACGDVHIYKITLTNCQHEFCENCLREVLAGQQWQQHTFCPYPLCLRRIDATDMALISNRIRENDARDRQRHQELRKYRTNRIGNEELVNTKESKPLPQTHECPTCSAEKPDNEFPQLSCGHNYCCNTCLETNIIDAAIRDRNATHVRCPLPSCLRALADADIHDQNKLRTIQYLRLRNQPNARQCPHGGCVYAYIYNGRPIATQCPLCTDRYCSNCLLNHDLQAMTCQQARAQEQARINGATTAELERISKACPHCGGRIQKTEGCNHMTCDFCHGEFCWICETDWVAEAHNDHKFGDYTVDVVRRMRAQHQEQIHRNNRPRINNNRPAPLFNRADFENNDFDIDQFLLHNRWEERRARLSSAQLLQLDNKINQRQTAANSVEQDARIWIEELTAIEQAPKNNAQPTINPQSFALILALIPPVFITWKIAQWITNPTAINTTIRELNSLIATAESTNEIELSERVKKAQKKLLSLTQKQINQLQSYATIKQPATFITYANTCKNELLSANSLKRIKLGCQADISKFKQWLMNN